MGLFGPAYGSVEWQVKELTERINELEFKINKTARKSDTTRSQQILILDYLGFFNTIKLNISNKKKAKLLSVLLNSSADNIEGDLSELGKKKNKYKTSQNLGVLLKSFEDCGLKELSKQVEIELNNVLIEEEKQFK